MFYMLLLPTKPISFSASALSIVIWDGWSLQLSYKCSVVSEPNPQSFIFSKTLGDSTIICSCLELLVLSLTFFCCWCSCCHCLLYSFVFNLSVHASCFLAETEAEAENKKIELSIFKVNFKLSVDPFFPSIFLTVKEAKELF